MRRMATNLQLGRPRPGRRPGTYGARTTSHDTKDNVFAQSPTEGAGRADDAPPRPIVMQP